MSHTAQLAVAAIVHYAANPKHAEVPTDLAKLAVQTKRLMGPATRPCDALMAAARQSFGTIGATQIARRLLSFGAAHLA